MSSVLLLGWRASGCTKAWSHVVHSWNYDTLSTSMCTTAPIGWLSFDLLFVLSLCGVITVTRYCISWTRSCATCIQRSIHFLLCLLLFNYVVVVYHKIIFEFEIIAVSYAGVSRSNGIAYLRSSHKCIAIHVECLPFVKLVTESSHRSIFGSYCTSAE